MGQKKKIMIIDDEVGLTNMLKLNLEQTGKYEVLVDNSGVKCLEVARKYLPDLILLDVLMPDMEGRLTASFLQASKETRNVPIVFLTATVSKEQAEAGHKVLEGCECLSKPVTMDVLLACIERNIRK